jgi:hypothetical protein
VSHARFTALAALPLLALAFLGPARHAIGGTAVLLCWAVVTAAGLAVFATVDGSPAARRWALVLWLYATPIFPVAALGEGPAFAAATSWAVAPPDLALALFSSRRGLFFHWPLLWTGVLGLPLLARRSPRLAAAAGGGLAVLFAVAACIPGSRPAVALLALPFVAPGLVACLEAVRRGAARRPLAVLGAAGAALVLWNLLFMRLYRDERIPRDDTVAFAQVAEGNARLLSEAVGSPTAWPANWLFAARHRLPPARFDLMAGKELPAGGLDVGRLDLDDALLAEGWSVRHACGEGGLCRAAEGRARLFLPLPDAGFAALGLAAGGEGRLAVALNGRPLGLLRVAPGVEAVLPVPEGLWRRGLNEVILEAVSGPVLVDRVRAARGGP